MAPKPPNSKNIQNMPNPRVAIFKTNTKNTNIKTTTTSPLGVSNPTQKQNFPNQTSCSLRCSNPPAGRPLPPSLSRPWLPPRRRARCPRRTNLQLSARVDRKTKAVDQVNGKDRSVFEFFVYSIVLTIIYHMVIWFWVISSLRNFKACLCSFLPELLPAPSSLIPRPWVNPHRRDMPSSPPVSATRSPLTFQRLFVWLRS